MRRGYTDWSQLPLILDAEQLAVVLAVSKSQIRRMIADGKINGFRVGREWRVTKDDLIKFCESFH